MLALVAFELKKLLRSRKNRIVFIVCVVAFISFAASNMDTYGERHQYENDYYRAKVIFWDGEIVEYGILMGMYGITDYEEREYYVLAKAAHELYQELYDGFLEGDRALVRDKLLEINQLLLEYNEWNNTLAEALGDDKQYADQRHILAEFVRYRQTMVDFYAMAQENEALLLFDNEMTGLNFLYQALKNMAPMLMLLIVFLTQADMFSQENEAGTYKFLLLQPMSRVKVFFCKAIAGSISAVIFVFGPMLIVFAGVGMLNGFGSPGYPVLYQTNTYATVTPINNDWKYQYLNTNTYSYIDSAYKLLHEASPMREVHTVGITPYSMWDRPYYYYTEVGDRVMVPVFAPHPDLSLIGMAPFMLLCLPLVCALFVATTGVAAFISVLTERNSLSMVLCAILSTLGVLCAAPLGNLSLPLRLNPVLYTNPVQILNGIGGTTALTGVLSTLGFSVVIYTVTLLIYRKKDIRC